MAAWKKWLVTIGMLLQGLIGGAIIMLWAFRSETWAQQIDNWLYSQYGQYTILALSGYLVFTALLTFAIAVFRPTTTSQLTIAKDVPINTKLTAPPSRIVFGIQLLTIKSTIPRQRSDFSKIVSSRMWRLMGCFHPELTLTYCNLIFNQKLLITLNSTTQLACGN